MVSLLYQTIFSRLSISLTISNFTLQTVKSTVQNSTLLSRLHGLLKITRRNATPSSSPILARRGGPYSPPRSFLSPTSALELSLEPCFREAAGFEIHGDDARSRKSPPWPPSQIGDAASASSTGFQGLHPSSPAAISVKISCASSSTAW
jgi:hypothetical protein